MELIIPGEFYEANVRISEIYNHPLLPTCALKDGVSPLLLADLVELYGRRYRKGNDLGPLSVVDDIHK